MVINYFGNGCFRLQSGDLSVLIDPEGNRLKADITLFTSATLKEGDVPEQDVINFPGEYESKGIEVDGMEIKAESSAENIKTAYLVRMEDIKVGILGQISKIPVGDVLERMETPDILIMPIQKGKFMSPEEAFRLAKELEPSVVIPSFYEKAEEIKKAFGSKEEPQEKFVCKKKDLEGGKIKLIILSSK